MEWMGIESAPKGGDYIWLANPGNMRLGFWNEIDAHWADLEKSMWGELVRDLHFTPTHWQSMPKPLGRKE